MTAGRISDSPSVRPLPSAAGPAPESRARAAERAAQPDPARLAAALERARRLAGGAAHALQFQVDPKTGDTLVQVIDRESGALLRQIPSEEMLALARALDRMQGLMLRLKA